jgi:hypothetical protein
MNRGMLILTSGLFVGVFGGFARGELRTWTARNGKYTVEAEFVRGDQQSVTLRRDGKEITIQLAQLSIADQQFVRDSLTAVKPAETASTAAVAGETKGGDEANEPTGDWVNLIDSSPFDQWTTTGAPGVFQLLPDSTIRGTGGRAYLVSPKMYSDFELTGRMKVSSRGNGGVFFDVPRGMNADSPRGYEVQLYVRRPGDTNGTGSIWDNGRLTYPLAGRFEVPGRWYSLYIRCQGPFIVVKIDNQSIFEREDNTRGGGHVALQCYEAEGEVHYTDMKIRELRPAEKTVLASASGEGKQVAAADPFAVFDIKLGMTDGEVAQVLLRKGIRPADVRIDEDATKGIKTIRLASHITSKSGTASRNLYTDLEVDFAEDLPVRPGTWVCIQVKYSKDFGDYGGVDLSPVWSKVRADVIQRFGPPSKQSDNEVLFGDLNARYLKASSPYHIELEDKELAKRLRDTFDQSRLEQAQQKALTQGENVAETIELNY